MGLYLCVFEGDEELDGLEIGSYADFNVVREYIVRQLEDGSIRPSGAALLGSGFS